MADSFRLFSIFSIIFLMVGCTYFCNVEDNLVCEDSVCWLGLIPQRTTYSEATSIITSNYGDSYTEHNEQYISWRSNKVSGHIRFSEDMVLYDVSVNFIEGELTISELLAQLGTPENIYISKLTASQNLCGTITLSYLEKGVYATLYTDNENVEITSYDSISNLSLFPVSQSLDSPPTDVWILDWQGYIDYCNLIPDR